MNYFNNIFAKLRQDRTRIRIWLFSLVASCILGASLAFFVLSIDKPFMGVSLSLDNQGSWVVQELDPNGLAIHNGIRVGDRAVEIDGQPAQNFLEKHKNNNTTYLALIKEISVVDASGQIKSVGLEDYSPSWQSLLESLVWFVLCLVFWLVGLFAFYKRPRSRAATLLCLCGLITGLALTTNTAAERAIPIAVQLSMVSAIIGPWLLVHFFLVLPEERSWSQKNPLIYLIYLPAVVMLILSSFIGYGDGQPLPEFRNFRLFEYGAGFLAAAGVMIFNYFHAASHRTRQQMKIVLISCLLALIPFLILNILPAALWGKTVLPSNFSILFLGFIPLGMGYAVVTKKLMDIDVIVRRSVIYGLVTIVMAAILSAAIFPLLALRKSLGTLEEILVALLLGAVATALFGPTKKGIEILIDKFFYKDRYDYRQIIQRLSTSLNSLKEFSDISRHIVGTAVSALHLAGGCLFIKNQSAAFEVRAAQGLLAEVGKQMKLLTLIYQRDYKTEFPNSALAVDPEVAFLIPLVAGEKEVGILFLSPKISRQNFSSDDIFLLQGLVSVAAVALRNAILTHDISLRDTFVSVASHELRTPLTAIMGLTELLLNRNPPEATQKQWLKKILDNSQRIADMVDDLLNVTRIQSGRVSMKLEDVNLPDVLAERLSMVQENAGKHEFLLDIQPGLFPAIVDRDKFGQIVGNLLSNAVKYSPRGGRITLAARNDPEQKQITVSVADQGMGISPADRESLFTTFHRIQRPETQGIRGSGLGLYIVKEWVEAMGGKVWIESELNKGSIFFVAVPSQNSKALN